ncbi:hypothetical protein COHA_001557 [Chlorella ohadii]|uniref:TLC domain-containing protein n=1 Tax=Chlorella ohadii TaxID=2649997 RepID=A0AAD5H5E8_9CHLO|nr:hypothetical protein COHA_001557 [Chlorella ohadii]
MKRATIVHDQVNLALIPLIGALTIAGLVGAIDPAVTTYAFLAYAALDSVWLILQPDAVPSLPFVILFHHAVTAVLLCVPLAHPHLHWYTCVDGIVELNTMFLIARRQLPWRAARKMCSWLYWGTFIPMRCILYPVMVPVFLREMQLVEHAPWWHTTACVGAQVILCVFNYVLLGLSLMRQRSKRGPGGAGAKGGKPAKAPAGSRELRDVQPELIKAQPAASNPLRLRARGL